MTDPKDSIFPMTVAELQEKIRKGEFRMEIADSTLSDHYEKHVRLILIAVGKYMTHEDETPEEWAQTCFVSDMSSVSDFALTKYEYDKIERALGLKYDPEEPIYAIAARMAGAN